MAGKKEDFYEGVADKSEFIKLRKWQRSFDNSDKTTRKTPNGIMDGFFKKANQKVNLGQRPTPACLPEHRYFRGPISERPVQKTSLDHKIYVEVKKRF